MAKRKIIEELVEGVEAMRKQREGKLTLRSYRVEAAPLPAVNSIPWIFVSPKPRFVLLDETLGSNSGRGTWQFIREIGREWVNSRRFRGYGRRLPMMNQLSWRASGPISGDHQTNPQAAAQVLW